MQSNVGTSGRLKTLFIPAAKPSIWWRIRNLRYLLPGLWHRFIARFFHIQHLQGALYVRHITAAGRVTDYGLVSLRLVTTAFVQFMVDQLQAETTQWGDFKYHDSGVGTTAAAVGDTDIETTDGESRATGSQEEGATADIYKSIGTINYTTTKAITEHGLFSQATGTTLMDRHVFSEINVDNGDSIQFTYELTVDDGG